FEAVVNSIHAIAESNPDFDCGEITIEIIRSPQSSLHLDDKAKRGAPPQEPIIGFKVIDNGVGFHDKNMESFETLDSEYKASQGCRGVGRLLWLKAFEGVNVSSTYKDGGDVWKARTFTFTASRGVADMSLSTPTPH
ncbi:ATP-binding protein, partial [Pseudomonas aeruginosa]|nr:ATP-binding protein [Pseudomonas aeruginosa]